MQVYFLYFHDATLQKIFNYLLKKENRKENKINLTCSYSQIKENKGQFIVFFCFFFPNYP